MKKIYTITYFSPDGRISILPDLFYSIDDVLSYLDRFIEHVPDRDQYELRIINDYHDNIVLYFLNTASGVDFIYHFHINIYLLNNE